MKLKTDILNIGKFVVDSCSDIVRIYPIIAEKGAAFPFAVYRRSGISPSNSKDRFNFEETVSMEVVVCATTYSESIALAQKIKDRMENKRSYFERSEITNIRLTNASEDWANDSYIQRLYFEIKVDNHQNLYS